MGPVDTVFIHGFGCGLPLLRDCAIVGRDGPGGLQVVGLPSRGASASALLRARAADQGNASDDFKWRWAIFPSSPQQ